MNTQECNYCFKRLYKTSKLKCDCCSLNFHFSCFTQNDKSIFNSSLAWLCSNCNIFPYATLTNLEMQDLFLNPRSLNNKMKCYDCNKKIKRNMRFKNCSKCNGPFHIKCSTKSTKVWLCSKCNFSELPFHKISNEDFFSFSSGFDESTTQLLKNTPSFNIKTLLDSLPGENFDKDDFISNTISSKYYSPIEFKQTRFNKKHLSIGIKTL